MSTSPENWTLADSIADAQRVEDEVRASNLCARVLREFLPTELGDHFDSTSLRVAGDGSTFSLRVDMPVHFNGVDYPEGATFTGDRHIVGQSQADSFY